MQDLTKRPSQDDWAKSEVASRAAPKVWLARLMLPIWTVSFTTYPTTSPLP